jgi:hypothetical protein
MVADGVMLAIGVGLEAVVTVDTLDALVAAGWFAVVAAPRNCLAWLMPPQSNPSTTAALTVPSSQRGGWMPQRERGAPTSMRWMGHVVISAGRSSGTPIKVGSSGPPPGAVPKGS